MGELIQISSFIEKQIAKHRLKMQKLMTEANDLIHETRSEGRKDKSYNFDKIGFAIDLLRKAETHSMEILRLEQKFLKKTA